MKPKRSNQNPQRELFRVELVNIIDTAHPLVVLGGKINWAVFEEQLGATYNQAVGAPGINTRLMVALHYLKYQYNLSDEAVVARWVENPYWQHFSGRQYFEHDLPIDPSSMTRWRKRLGEAGAEAMLKATIDTGIQMKAIRAAHVAHVNIDTTVQTKAIRHPTDARLYQRACERLVIRARKDGLSIKQSFGRVGRLLVMKASRYAHARQMRRARACTRKLRTNLGRVIREVERQDVASKPQLSQLLSVCRKIHSQKRTDSVKVYSVHEPEAMCIAKGKARVKYEFGQKASVAVTSKGGWILGAKNMPGNPYDGHTLGSQIEQIGRIYTRIVSKQTAHVDMGYRGHGYIGPMQVIVDKRRKGETPKRVWKWMKRRAAVEPTIGHLKTDHRLERNQLRGIIGDSINAILSAAAMNFSKLLGFVLAIFLALLDLITPPEHQECTA